MNQSAMIAWLVKDAEIAEAEAKALVPELSLGLRSGFGRDLPKGIQAAEEYPWRYRRRLSVLWKPIIALDKSADPKLIVCADLFGTTCRYRCYHLYAGIIPAERMRTKAMRELIGNSAVQQGHGFAKRVHDLNHVTIVVPVAPIDRFADARVRACSPPISYPRRWRKKTCEVKKRFF
jgi:hypothetical protein